MPFSINSFIKLIRTVDENLCVNGRDSFFRRYQMALRTNNFMPTSTARQNFMPKLPQFKFNADIKYCDFYPLQKRLPS